MGQEQEAGHVDVAHEVGLEELGARDQAEDQAGRDERGREDGPDDLEDAVAAEDAEDEAGEVRLDEDLGQAGHDLGHGDGPWRPERASRASGGVLDEPDNVEDGLQAWVPRLSA